MRLSEVRRLYDVEGPFATVYMEGRSPAEDAEQQVRLRWDDLKGRLAAAGAGEPVLEALETAVLVEDIGEVQASGRTLVASGSDLLLDATWDAALGAGDSAYFGPEPDLGAYVRERVRSVRLLVAVADQHGAVVRRIVAAEHHSLNERDDQRVAGAAEGSVHKPREGALSHKQIQRRADEAVKKNVREVAAYLDRVAGRWHPDVMVLAGEVQGRAALRDELSDRLQDICRDTDRGGIDDEGGEQALTEELRTIAGEVSERHAQDLTERFEHAAAHDLAVTGAASVDHAAQMGAIETLVLEEGQQAVDEAVLLAASARIDAQVGLINASVQDGVAALLRFELPDEGTR